MTDTEREQHQSRLPGTGLLALLACLGPLLYVLSIGPVVMVAESQGVGQETVRRLYYPVIWLHHNTPLQQPLEWYAMLWGWQ